MSKHQKQAKEEINLLKIRISSYEHSIKICEQQIKDWEKHLK